MNEEQGFSPKPLKSGEPALVIWKWRESVPGAPSLSRARLRRRGWIRAALGLAVAGVFAFLGWRTLALVAGAFALLGGIGATFAPEAFDRALHRFTTFVGSVLTVILLAPLYMLFFTPFGWLFRSGDRDRMTPRIEPAVSTYWSSRDPLPVGTAPLKRQF